MVFLSDAKCDDLAKTLTPPSSPSRVRSANQPPTPPDTELKQRAGEKKNQEIIENTMPVAALNVNSKS